MQSLRPRPDLLIQNLNQLPRKSSFVKHWSRGHCGTERGRGKCWANWPRWKKKERRITEGCKSPEIWEAAEGRWTKWAVAPRAQGLLSVAPSWVSVPQDHGVNYGHKALRGPAVNHPCKRCPSLEAGDVYRRRPVPQSSLGPGGGGLRANRV